MRDRSNLAQQPGMDRLTRHAGACLLEQINFKNVHSQSLGHARFDA